MSSAVSSRMTGHTPRRSFHWRYGVGIIALILLAVGFIKHQVIVDWIKLRQYRPSSAISQLADDTTMTAKARQLFYLNHPAVEAKAQFTKSCPNDGEETIVLGCYRPPDEGIYIVRVNDERLAGVEQVTAAHEMLHAAYRRLPPAEKRHVNKLLQQYYDHGLNDGRIKDTLASYRKSEPGQQLNEMHSIFGTEIISLPPELEAYYRRYFDQRSKIAGYAGRYQAAFTSRKDAVTRDDALLKTWKQQITQQQKALQAQDESLQTMDERMQREKADGQIDTYNGEVGRYNQLVNDYNAAVASLKQLVSRYNQLVDERNATALQEQQLQQSLGGSVPSMR